MDLSVRAEAAQLLYRYAELIDDGDFAGVGALLGGATVTLADGTPIATGATEVEALYTATTRRLADGTPRTQHVVSNVIVEPVTAGPDHDRGGERWEVRARFTVLQATDDLPLQPVAAGRYRDVVERDADGRLAIVVHAMAPILWGDISEHLLLDPR